MSASNILNFISEPIPAPFEERELLLARAFLHLREAVKAAEDLLMGYAIEYGGGDARQWLSKYSSCEKSIHVQPKTGVAEPGKKE